jgi:hypothetical protein
MRFAISVHRPYIGTVLLPDDPLSRDLAKPRACGTVVGMYRLQVRELPDDAIHFVEEIFGHTSASKATS